MEKSYVINRIKELCNKKNDREIALDFSYNNRIFHAKYLFLRLPFGLGRFAVPRLRLGDGIVAERVDVARIAHQWQQRDIEQHSSLMQ